MNKDCQDYTVECKGHQHTNSTGSVAYGSIKYSHCDECNGFAKEPVCMCFDYYESAHYDAQEDPHSVSYKWRCDIHGKQERYHLIHTDKQPYCQPCVS